MGKRSIHLHDSVTSISMEPALWAELDRIAAQQSLSWAQLVRKWLVAVPEPVNRSAAIKEMIVHHLRQDSQPDIVAQWQIDLPGGGGTQLVVTRGRRLFLGRIQPADIVINHPEISRRHAMLVFDEADWWAIDLGSKNGLAVAGQRVQAIKANIGTRIGLGSVTLQRTAKPRASNRT